MTTDNKNQKLSIKRVFTKAGQHPFDTVKWVRRDAVITGAGGKEVFRQDGVEVQRAGVTEQLTLLQRSILGL